MRDASTYRAARRNAVFNKQGMWSEKYYAPQFYRDIERRDNNRRIKREAHERRQRMLASVKAMPGKIKQAVTNFVRPGAPRARASGRGT